PRHRFFELQQVGVEVAHHALLEGASGLPELLPVGHLLDGDSPLAADGLGCLAEVAPELRVGEALLRGVLEGRRRARGESVRKVCLHYPSPISLASISAR